VRTDEDPSNQPLDVDLEAKGGKSGHNKRRHRRQESKWEAMEK